VFPSRVWPLLIIPWLIWEEFWISDLPNPESAQATGVELDMLKTKIKTIKNVK
jgi:hypothetical protein